VTPLFYQRLQIFKSNFPIPDQIMPRVRELYLAHAARNIRLYHELTQVLTILQGANIPVVVLKGAHLAELVYKNIALRSMGDIDLLVKKDDLRRSQQGLIKAGYASFKTGLILDLHWNIENPLFDMNIDVAGLWDRAQPATVAGVDTLILAPEDLLLHLCLQLAFHHLFQLAALRALYDIREVSRVYCAQIQWKQLCSRARAWEMSHAVYLTFILAKEIVGAQIPDEVVEELKPDDFDPQIKTWALKQIFQTVNMNQSLSPFFCQLWKPGPFNEKLSAFRKLFFPSSEVVSQKYFVPFQSFQNYLSYIVRLKDHGRRYTHALWRLLIHDREMVALLKQQQENLAMREWLVSE
jgi:hypothetical protein